MVTMLVMTATLRYINMVLTQKADKHTRAVVSEISVQIDCRLEQGRAALTSCKLISMQWVKARVQIAHLKLPDTFRLS